MDSTSDKTPAGDGAAPKPVTPPATTATADIPTPAAPAVAEASSAPATKAAEAVASDIQKTPAGPSPGMEPAAQVASAKAHPVTPPRPASYEMPDDYADESWFDTAKAWVEQNPALAVLAATGVGLVVGRLVMGLAPDPEPPSLADRVEKRAREIAEEGKKGGRRAAKKAQHVASDFASDAQDSVSDGLHRAAGALRDARSVVADRAESGAERTRDVAESVADAVKVALAGVAAKAVDEWVSRVK
jgi:ElaB/YqjD/DUF883 family membrane-anchored ribosome-binding protein